jgi:hypothetical protein
MVAGVFEVFAGVLLVSICHLSWRIIYNLYLHPLADIPGPRWAAVTSLWLFFKEMHGDGHEQILHLHKKYGEQ